MNLAFFHFTTRHAYIYIISNFHLVLNAVTKGEQALDHAQMALVFAAHVSGRNTAFKIYKDV